MTELFNSQASDGILTADAHRLLTAFRKVKRLSNGPVNLDLVKIEAGFDQNTPLGRISFHEALRELVDGGYVVEAAVPGGVKL